MAGRLHATLAAFGAAGLVFLAPSHGRADPASLSVRAAVLPHASVRIAPPATLTLTDADVARGYVELATPVQVETRSNARHGYTLVFQRFGDAVLQARVQGLSTALLVREQGLARREPTGPGMWRDLVQLRIRFELAPGTRAGAHPWPLQISMTSP
jgi:hypothetical protein